MVRSQRFIVTLGNAMNQLFAPQDLTNAATIASKRCAPRVDIVVPCYNEQEALPRTREVLTDLLRSLAAAGRIAPDSRVVFVDDGSRDGTWSLIEAAARECPEVCGVKLSRNCGHQLALLAGLNTSTADAAISIDADLQDDVNVVARMVDQYAIGKDVVFGVRKDRSTDSWFKRSSANAYYGLVDRLGIKVVRGHADFRLMSRRALDALAKYQEDDVYLRGLMPLIGFETARVEYDRLPRLQGETKYPLRKMLALAANGVMSFSPFPLRMIAHLGVVICVLCAGYGIFAVIQNVRGHTVAGWTSIVVPIYFLGGVQMLCIGVIGEYVSKLYVQSKHRPRYFVEAIVDNGR